MEAAAQPRKSREISARRRMCCRRNCKQCQRKGVKKVFYMAGVTQGTQVELSRTPGDRGAGTYNLVMLRGHGAYGLH